MFWGAIAADGFVEELEKELAWRSIVPAARNGAFFLFEGEPVELFWSAVRWLDVQRLEVPSISAAAKTLRPLARRWVLCPAEHHRRATLIAESLRLLSAAPADFPLQAEEGVGAFLLLAPGEVLWCKSFDRPHPLGQANFAENLEAPSRAYLKLWEALSLHPERLKAGSRCLDLGASPGGWTWVLARLGASVLAADRAPLAPSVAAMPGVEFRSGNAFAVTPELVGKVDWLCSDLICYPEKLREFLDLWQGQAAHFICTIKFQGASDLDAAARFLELGGRVLHLHHNKHEVTWMK